MVQVSIDPVPECILPWDTVLLVRLISAIVLVMVILEMYSFTLAGQIDITAGAEAIVCTLETICS
jgi:hypothetical protein